MRMRSIMRWRGGLAFACEGIMIGLLTENETDCLIRQHMEPPCASGGTWHVARGTWHVARGPGPGHVSYPAVIPLVQH
jgi:hypothetical protein